MLFRSPKNNLVNLENRSTGHDSRQDAMSCYIPFHRHLVLSAAMDKFVQFPLFYVRVSSLRTLAHIYKHLFCCGIFFKLGFLNLDRILFPNDIMFLLSKQRLDP